MRLAFLRRVFREKRDHSCVDGFAFKLTRIDDVTRACFLHHAALCGTVCKAATSDQEVR